jgi:hypothetical protein
MQACWAVRADNQYVHLYYSDGDEGLVHLSQFKKTRQL